MGLITTKSEGGIPATPPAGYVTLFNDGSSWKYKTDAGTVLTLSTGISAEEVQDLIGAFFQDSSTIDVVYNDGGDVISANVLASAVNHNGLLNYLANEHVNHATVSVNAGTGLTGGGDLTATRTISMPNTGTAGTYRSVTTDAQGRVTAGTNPTTLAGYGITDAQPLDSDLTAVANLATTGFITRTATGTATTRTVTAGTGVSVSNGDGVSGNPTVGLANTTVVAGTYGNNAVVPQITVNAQGQITNVANSSIAINSLNITDFNEAAQDAVGGILVDSSSIDFTYSDGGNSIQAFVIPGGVDHNGLVNLAVGNPHTQYLLSSAAASTYQPLDSDLTALAGLAGTGIICRTAANTYAERFIAVSTGLGISNPGGVGGNPTIFNADLGSAAVATHEGLADPHPQYLTVSEGNAIYQPLGSYQASDGDLTAVANLATTGLVARTATNTMTTRTIAAGTGITLANGDGISGNPTITNSDTGSSAVTTHNAASDPHTQYQLEANLEADVRNTDLAGFSASPDTPVVATDVLLAAIGKLQAQIDRLTSEDNNWQEETKTTDTIVSSNVTLTNITDLGISVVAGTTYYLEYTLLFRTAATTTGFAVSINTSDTAVGEGSLQVNIPIATDGTAALYTGTINGFGDVVVSTGVQTANPSWFICNMKGIFRCTTSGTLVPQFRSEVNGSNVNCGQGSTVLARGF